MITALLAAIHDLTPSSELARALAEDEVDDDRGADAERPDQDEDGQRDRLLSGRRCRSRRSRPRRRRSAAGSSGSRRTAARRSRAPSRGLKLSIVVIHFGSAFSSSPRGRPRHCLNRERHQRQAEHELEHADPGRGLAVVGRRRSRPRRAGRSRPTIVRPPSQPSRKARPLARARGVASIRTMAMIGTGLSADHHGEREDLADGFVHGSRSCRRPGGIASPRPHEVSSPRVFADCRAMLWIAGG